MTRWLRAGLLGCVILGAVAGIVAWFGWEESERILRTPIGVTAPVLYELEKGSNLSRLAREFEHHGWIANRHLFAWRARADGRANALQAGIYEIAPGDTPADVLDRIVAGLTRTFDVTFIEGSRFSDMRRVLARQRYLRQTLAGLSPTAILAALGAGATSPEGLFFPSTYRYEAASADFDVLARAYRRMADVLDAAWQARDPELPYATPYEALVMASIIEKETGRAGERREIAGVFVRRLRLGMKLQTDPTVIYGLGDAFDGNLRRADLIRDTPYNTYTRHGLPPTPIAMPGEAAIRAALDPAPGKTLYFVARGDGTHVFSATLAEHNAAVRRFQLRR